MKKLAAFLLAVMMMTSVFTSCGSDDENEDILDIPVVKKPTYMIYYGVVDDDVVENAQEYDIAILHPRQGNLTRKQVEKIQSAGTKVLGYIAIGEDLRTAGRTPADMLADERFTGDGTGPKVDARTEEETSLAAADINGAASPGGSGYASYYLDDNDRDGNGRGLGCDGLFLDTVDTCAPNGYTSDEDPGRTRFEWTAPGVNAFMQRVKENYPDKLICQNRGLFFYNHLLEHYHYSPRQYVDYLFYESYMLDSNPTQLYNEGFFADNKFNQLPKLSVEASRPDGFTVLSLGYAEGPKEYGLKKALEGKKNDGVAILREEIAEAENVAGFSHYITDGNLTMINDFVKDNRIVEDDEEPKWSSVYNNSTKWPPHEPEARVGIISAEPVAGGAVVSWDVALDKTGVTYVLYYRDKPFDFAADPELKDSQQMILEPTVTQAYEQGQYDALPYQAEVTGLESGRTYYMVIRAIDQSEAHNDEKNTVYLTVTPN